jgi:hypothetical protein
MLSNNPKITDLQFNDSISKLHENKDKAHVRKLISEMSFRDYHDVAEASADIVPPSGNTITPTVAATTGTTQPPVANGVQVPGSANSSANGVNSMLNTDQTIQGGQPVIRPGTTPALNNNQQLAQQQAQQPGNINEPSSQLGQPLNNQQQSSLNGVPTQSGTAQQEPMTSEEQDIQRMRQLAGIKENASAGATGSGGIATAATPLGKTVRRQRTYEQPKVEYTPKEAAKTIAGDTKPNQAAGKLSADLAARGQVSAGRTNNGFKK